MLWLFSIYKNEAKDKGVSGVRNLESSDDPSADMIESAECKTREPQMALSEDTHSDITSDTHSDYTDYDAMYSDGTDSDAMSSGGESSDDSSSEDEGSSPKNNAKSPGRQNKLRIPTLAEVCLRYQSQHNRNHTDGGTVATLRYEHEKRHLTRQAEALPTHLGSETRSLQTSIPAIKSQA